MYRSGNVELGASVKGWMDQFAGLLTSAGWTLAEDLFPEEAPEGSRLFAPEADLGNGYLEVFVNNSVTRLRMVKSAKRRFATRSVERDHDLANGFNYFADLSGNHVALILETPAGVSTPIVAGVAEPDALSPAWAAQEMEPPRGFTCEPVEDIVSVTHHLIASSATRYSYGIASRGAWTLYSGHDHQSAWYSLRSQPTKDVRFTSLSPGVLESGEAIYPPSLIIGEAASLTNASFATLVAYAGWNALPGVYLTNATAGDRVAILGDDGDTLYGGGGRILAADVAADADAVSLDADALPTTGVLRIGEEYLSYSQKSAEGVSGLTRGLYGTQSTAHAVTQAPFTDDFSGDLSAYESEPDGADTSVQEGALRFSNSSRTFRHPRLHSPFSAADGSLSVRADFSNLSTSEYAILTARRVDAHYLSCEVYKSAINFYEYAPAKRGLGGVSSSTFPFPLDAQHTLRLELKGRAMRLYVDDEFFAAMTTPEAVKGQWGLGAQLYNTDRPVTFDDLNISAPDTRVYLGSWWVKSGSAVIAAGGEKP